MTAVASGVTVYYGASVKLDGAASTGAGTLAFAWSLANVPAGSALSTASLIDADSATPSFVPDAVGSTRSV